MCGGNLVLDHVLDLVLDLVLDCVDMEVVIGQRPRVMMVATTIATRMVATAVTVMVMMTKRMMMERKRESVGAEPVLGQELAQVRVRVWGIVTSRHSFVEYVEPLAKGEGGVFSFTIELYFGNEDGQLRTVAVVECAASSSLERTPAGASVTPTRKWLPLPTVPPK